MNKALLLSIEALNFLGFYPRKLFSNLKGMSFYLRDIIELKKQKGNDTKFPFMRKFPILNDRFREGGIMKGHYFHQDLFVAQLIFKNNPVKHVDIGSRTDGFVAHVASFREIEIFDIRNIHGQIENIVFKQLDMMNPLNGMNDYCDSISSLHAIEHFGLGRYGDPIDYIGHEKALENISIMLRKEGTFYFSVPIGKQRIEFNSERIFSVKYLLEILSDSYNLRRFSYVDDNGAFHKNVELTKQVVNRNFNCNYGCGIFELIKK